MEEVDGSNPSRSTKTFHTLTVPLPPDNLVTGVHLESKTHLTLGIRSHPSAAHSRPSLLTRSEASKHFREANNFSSK